MLLAAVAVAMGARRYAVRHIDAVALMKCMGASQGFVLAISIIELALLAVFAVAIGALLGYLAQEGLAWVLRDLIRTELPAASLAPLPIALVTVLAMLIGFALPPLLQLKSTPPGTGVAQERERAAAALWLELSPGAGSVVRDFVEPGAGYRVGALGPCRRVGRRFRADARRLWPSPAYRPPSRRSRCRLAIRARECACGAVETASCKSLPLVWG